MDDHQSGAHDHPPAHRSKAHLTAARKDLRIHADDDAVADDAAAVATASTTTTPQTQTFLELTPDGAQDAHDLSIHPQQITRDSLVDSMLLSLDQMAPPPQQSREGFAGSSSSLTSEDARLYSSLAETDGTRGWRQQRTTGTAGSPRASTTTTTTTTRGHAYTYSSDYEDGAHGRRSRGKGKGKGSKHGSASSLDTTDYMMMPSPRKAAARRSTSVDHGQEVPYELHHHGNPNYTSFDYDAAPTPTIPGGPGRYRPSSPIFVNSQPSTPPTPVAKQLDRKKSSKPSKPAYRSKISKPAAAAAGSAPPAMERELPPLPPLEQPEVRSSPVAQVPPSPIHAHPARERTGFFRRVFGSSRGHAPALDPPKPYSPSASNDTIDRSPSRNHHVPSKASPVPTRRESPAPTQPPPPPPPPPPQIKDHTPMLSKRPSSFFRRRKKSVTASDQHVAVPALPAESPRSFLDNLRMDLRPEESPASSLRHVMIPYLQNTDKEHPPLPLSQQDYSLPWTAAAAGIVHHGSSTSELVGDATIRPVKNNLRPAIDMAAAPIDDPDPAVLKIPDANLPAAKASLSTTPTPAYQQLQTSTTMSIAIPTACSLERVTATSQASPATTHKSSLDPDVEGPSVYVTPLASPQSPLPPNREFAQSQSNYSSRTNLQAEAVHSSTATPEDPTAPPRSPQTANTDTLTRAADAAATTRNAPPLHITTTNLERPKTRALLIMQTPDSSHPDIITTPDVEGDADLARSIFDGTHQTITKDKAAAWLGQIEAANARTLQAYMELHDFTNQNILAALRSTCNRLVLKAESQQVDRILAAFAVRWCQCNANHGFKATDVVHTICFSLMLLNTDLHLADIEQKMTRSQFVKNTMPTIRKSVLDAAPDAFESSRPSILPNRNSTFERPESPTAMVRPPMDSLAPRKSSAEVDRSGWRLSFRMAPRSDFEAASTSPTATDYDFNAEGGPLVRMNFQGTLRAWEQQVEAVLKDFYTSIKTERLPLSGVTNGSAAASTSNLQVITNGVLRRSPSVLSKAPSEAQASMRGRPAESMRMGANKWATKNRSRTRLYPSSAMGSSRTSLDDQSSLWSPSVSSSTWSKHSLGKTHTSMSVDSLATSFPQSDYQQSIGFANALSQAIIREDAVLGSTSEASGPEDLRSIQLLEDESLGLVGAPWAKEGIVKHKHHLESLDRKAKDRSWNEAFAVVEKGYLSLFSFSVKSMRKSRGRAAGGVVGGGNWQENAESLGSFLLRQTIASALPTPGYSKTRPHVWALSLPTGAVHLFQVGTPDIVKEFVSSANYWSARLSNHPLVGGISNIEYGWSDSIINKALVTAINETTTTTTSGVKRPSTSGTRPSLQSSIRSSIDHNYGANVRARLPGDRLLISDWTPPTQNMRASNLLEPDQLRTLQAYVTGIESELQTHNRLRNPMLLAFTPRHPNSAKAMANWEKKSSYLLREIVKFRTYIDSLQGAEATKQRVYAERALAAVVDEEDEEEGEGEAQGQGPVSREGCGVRRGHDNARGQQAEENEEGQDDEEDEQGDTTLKPAASTP